MAVPRIDPSGGSGIGLPQPLAPSEAARVRRIFALQAGGEFFAAAAETARLQDTTLLGHLLADRYLRDPVHAAPPELSDWLQRFADQPDAPAIHDLLLARAPHGARLPPAPQVVALGTDAPLPEEADPAANRIRRNPLLDRTVREMLRTNSSARALSLIARTPGMDATYGAQLRAEVAQSLFSNGDDQAAYDLARRALAASHGEIGLAGFIAGLAAWAMERPADAAPMFEQAWRSTYAAPSLRMAAAFWAARAKLRAGDIRGYMPWMRRAAEQPRTFYGLLARRRLGLDTEFAGRPPVRETLGEADVAAVDATAPGHRAFALLQVGQDRQAAAELRLLWPQTQANPPLGRSILLVATQAGLTDLAAELATVLQAEDGKPRDDLRFPLPHLVPRGGFKVDPAMLYGLARLESNFDADAVSRAGATGLMQLMPVTAGYLADTPGEAHDFVRHLREPSVNLQIAQRYILDLAQHDAVHGDLIRLLASYNAGPTNTAKWSDAAQHESDPLLFIERIPFDETRDYIKHALTYTWIYAARLHQSAPSLDELAAGAWPHFVPLDDATAAIAPDIQIAPDNQIAPDTQAAIPVAQLH